jgi:hypothetical protein
MLRIIAAVLIATSLALPASAQSVCGERGKFLEHLGSNYQEGPVAMGLVSNGSVLEVLTSEKGSWTIIVTQPDGKSCVVAAGESWENVPLLVAGPTA